jgi:hypothetical protein
LDDTYDYDVLTLAPGDRPQHVAAYLARKSRDGWECIAGLTLSGRACLIFKRPALAGGEVTQATSTRLPGQPAQ